MREFYTITVLFLNENQSFYLVRLNVCQNIFRRQLGLKISSIQATFFEKSKLLQRQYVMKGGRTILGACH